LSLVQLNDLPSGVFKAHERVIGSHPLLAGARVPRFGDAVEWNLNGVIRRPANLPASAWTVVFSDELAEPSWNLLARELSMIMFNPRHPAVIAAGVSLKPAPANPVTAIARLSHLRRMASWAEANGLPPQLADWQENDLRRLIQGLGEQLANNTIRNYITTLKWLRQCSPALTDKGLQGDPWAPKSARKASNVARSGGVSTAPIPPEQWFPLVRAAWTYVHTFAPDTLRAQQRYEELIANAAKIPGGHEARLDRYLADPANPIPVHTAANQEHGRVHWSLLALMLGSENSSRSNVFRRDLAAGRRRIARVEQALATGHPTTTGVIDGLAVVKHTDGASAPGIPGSTLALSAWNAACFATPAMYWLWRYR
jgi:hypothetical protein